MTTIGNTAAGTRTFASAADEAISLGAAGVTDAHLYAVQVVGDGWTGAITFKARVAGSGADAVPVPYVVAYADGAVGTDGISTAEITDDALIYIASNGREIIADHDWTAGSVTLYVRQVRGPLPIAGAAGGGGGGGGGDASAANQTTEIARLTSIRDGVGSATDAAVAAGAAGTLSAQLRRVTTDLASLNGKVTAVNTGAVTVGAALPAGTNNIGDVDVLTLPALPAGTNNIGDVDVLTLPALPSGTNTIGATKDAGPQATVTRTYTTSNDMTTAADIAPAPTSGQKVVAQDILVSSDTAMLFKVQMETSGNVLAAVRIPADGTVQITLRGWLKGDAADKKLQGKASSVGNVYITAVTHSEA